MEISQCAVSQKSCCVVGGRLSEVLFCVFLRGQGLALQVVPADSVGVERECGVSTGGWSSVRTHRTQAHSSVTIFELQGWVSIYFHTEAECFQREEGQKQLTDKRPDLVTVEQEGQEVSGSEGPRPQRPNPGPALACALCTSHSANIYQVLGTGCPVVSTK